MRNGLLLVLLLGMAMPVQAIDPLSLYGREATYTVERKGKPIGTYDLRFMPWQRSGFQVEVDMRLTFNYLAVFDYEFQYQAREYWRDSEQLEQLEVRIDDDGKVTSYSFKKRDRGLYRELGGEPDTYVGRQLITSNHWHPALVKQDRLINTLTGKVSSLDVVLEAEETVQVGAQTIMARRYRLGGELGNTRSWYDLDQRWLGMEFDVRDGSQVRIWLAPGIMAQKDKEL